MNDQVKVLAESAFEQDAQRLRKENVVIDFPVTCEEVQVANYCLQFAQVSNAGVYDFWVFTLDNVEPPAHCTLEVIVLNGSEALSRPMAYYRENGPRPAGFHCRMMVPNNRVVLGFRVIKVNFENLSKMVSGTALCYDLQDKDLQTFTSRDFELCIRRISEGPEKKGEVIFTIPDFIEVPEGETYGFRISEKHRDFQASRYDPVTHRFSLSCNLPAELYGVIHGVNTKETPEARRARLEDNRKENKRDEFGWYAGRRP